MTCGKSASLRCLQGVWQRRRRGRNEEHGRLDRVAVGGDNALTGTYNGKQEVGELWGKFLSKDFSTAPHDFVADGDKVVILTTVTLEGETVESADISTYNADGKLVAFDTLGDPTIVNRVFAN